MFPALLLDSETRQCHLTITRLLSDLHFHTEFLAQTRIETGLPRAAIYLIHESLHREDLKTEDGRPILWWSQREQRIQISANPTSYWAELGTISLLEALYSIYFTNEKKELGLSHLVQHLSGIRGKNNEGHIVIKRLHFRLREVGLPDIKSYVPFLFDNWPDEIPKLVDTAATNTTSFFREKQQILHCAQQVVDIRRRTDRPIRIWSAACSTGEEVYSIASSVLGALKPLGFRTPASTGVEVFGTDISSHALEIAKRGIYPAARIRHLDTHLTQELCERGTGHLSDLIRIRDDVFELASFVRFNLLDSEPPVDGCNFIFCRNVFIYFDAETISKIMRMFHQQLVMPKGLLYLGSSDTVPESTEFRSLGKKVYQMREAVGDSSPPPQTLHTKLELPKPPNDKENSSGRRPSRVQKSDVVVLGASTGGTKAISEIVEQLTNPIPPLVIAQHLAEEFYSNFRDSLQKKSVHPVTFAENGDVLKANHIYIAPGGLQTRLRKRGPQIVFEVSRKGNDHERFKPSVDVLFTTAARLLPEVKITAIILTGMGRDGVEGMKHIYEQGGQTLAQDSASCAVFGMPKCAVEHGVVRQIVSLSKMFQHVA